MDFRNSSQNRKAVKIEADSRSHTKVNIKSLPTLFSKEKKVKKSWKKVEKKLENGFPKLESESKSLSLIHI